MHKRLRIEPASSVKIVTAALDDMDLKPPKPSASIEEIRKLYEQDAAKATGA